MMKMKRMNLMISRKFDEEEDFDEESDDEHDEKEKNEFEDIEEAAYFKPIRHIENRMHLFVCAAP